MSDTHDGNRSDATDEQLQSQRADLAGVIELLNQARDAVVATPPNQKGKQPRPPSKLDDFELLSPIGQGGMGVVYEARQRSLDRIVALKVLPRSVLPESLADSKVKPTSQQKLVQRFHIEARAAARLHHPNIVPVFGFGEDAGFYYFVMQRIYGTSLERWIKLHVGENAAEPLDNLQLARFVADFGRQAAEGLAYAHGENILHRDIKPANLLIDEDEKLQIADFGVARVDDSEALTRTHDVVGTLRYMSPEQITGDSCPCSDVYSLGVTLYEMATGRPAVDDASVRQALMLQKKPSRPLKLAQLRPELPLDLRTIIEKAMDPNPPLRYSSASLMAEDLSRFLRGAPILARPMPWWERTSRWVRRNPLVSALASMLFLTLVSAVAVLVVSQIRIGRALDETMSAKRSTERTAALATGAIEQIFDRYSSSTDSTSLSLDATDFSAPAVDRKTAELLEELLGYYDLLANQAAEESSEGQSLAMARTQARMHLGAIHQQLGHHLQAVEAYQSALSDMPVADKLIEAKLLNRIGLAYEAMGLVKQSKPSHRRAMEILRHVDSPDSNDSAFRFELARTLLLLARRQRPGMGPQSAPPVEAFSWTSRDGGFRLGRHPPPRRHERPLDFVDWFATEFALEAPTRRSDEDQAHFEEAIELLVTLREQVNDSLPITLLLSNVVRNELGDLLRAENSSIDRSRSLLSLADQLRDDLKSKLGQKEWAGRDAAIAYELTLLYADFSVFRPLDAQELNQGILRIEQALPIAEYLVDRYPAVPAYELLSIHTAFKAATLRTRDHQRRPGSERDLRDIRVLLRQALRRQTRLLDQNEDAAGYSLWCSLFLMRIGEVQLRSGEDVPAVRSFRRGLKLVPLQQLARLYRPEVQSSVEQPPTRVPSENPAFVATVRLLERLDDAARRHDPATSDQADRLAHDLRHANAESWPEISERLQQLVAGKEL